jgi:hypothetical protein
MMQASKVAVFHSKYHPIKKEVENISTVPYYNELASTDFEIVSDDEDIIAKFKQIKEQIKEQTQCNK